jgi:CBS domain-containing protein
VRGGRWTSGKEPARRQREIDYPRIDRGDRSTFLERLLDQRVDRARLLLQRRERQAVRFRDRFATYEKRQRAPTSAVRSSRPLSPAHLKRRASQAKGLAQMVDQLVRSLMRGLSRDQGRLRGLVSQRDLARALGGGRQRGRGFLQG